MKGLSSGLVIGLTILLVFAACLAALVAFVYVQRSRRAQVEKNLLFVDTTSTINSPSVVDLEKLKFDANSNSDSSSKLASPYASVKSIGTGLTFVSNEAVVHGDDSATNHSMKSGKPYGLPSSPSSPRKSKLYQQGVSSVKHNGLPISPTSPSSPRKSRVNVTIPSHAPSIRRLSSQEILAHHTANGTMTRPFAPLLTTLDPDTVVPGSPYIHQKSTARVSRSSIITNRRRSSLYLSTSAGEGDPNVDDPSLSSISIVSQASSSAAAAQRAQAQQQQRPQQPSLFKVRTIFTPLLPDELVLRPHEKLTFIKKCSDGWCIVGRKSPFYAPSPVRKEFGHRNYTERPDEIEIGAVSAWVFDNDCVGSGRENVPGERPLRSESLSVIITMHMGNEDDEVGQKDNWSNVY